MIKILEKLICDKGRIAHHIIRGNGDECFYIVFDDDLNSNESFWKLKITNEFLPRKCYISFSNNRYADVWIEKSIKIDRKEKTSFSRKTCSNIVKGSRGTKKYM